jgi:hypothetical protein
MVKSKRRGEQRSRSCDRERWPSGLRRTLGKRVYRKVPWVRIPLSPPLIEALVDAIKESEAEPIALPLVPFGSFIYFALRDRENPNIQRGCNVLSRRRIFAIASRASTAVFRSSSNVASRSSRMRFVSSSRSFSGRIGVMLMGIS